MEEQPNSTSSEDAERVSAHDMVVMEAIAVGLEEGLWRPSLTEERKAEIYVLMRDYFNANKDKYVTGTRQSASEKLALKGTPD